MVALKRTEVITLATAVGICLLAAMATLGVQSVFVADTLPIRWIEAQGAFQRVNAQQIRTAATPLLDGGFFGSDLERIRHAVEDIPWIRSAGVQRQWPDKVQIRVLEHQPLGQWGEGRLVSDAGEVFQVAGAASISGLAALSGPDERAPEVVAFYRQLREQLQPTGLDVSRLGLSERGAWEGVLTGGVTVFFGSSDLERRMGRLIVALEKFQAQSAGRLNSIDLRYTNGLAVRWRDESTLAETRVDN